GILAQDQWSGALNTGNSITILNSATINSGTTQINLADAPSGTPRGPAGIRAGILNGANGTQNPSIIGDVSVTNTGNITALAGSGIFAFNFGSGNTVVSNDATIVANNAGPTSGSLAQYGIFAFNDGKGSSTVATGFNSAITSGSTGINAGNQAGSIAQGSGSAVTVVAMGS